MLTHIDIQVEPQARMEKCGSLFVLIHKAKGRVLMTRRLLIRGVGIRADDGVERTSPSKAAMFGFLQMGSRPRGSRWP